MFIEIREKNMKEKIWSLLVYLSENQWQNKENYGVKKPIRFCDDFWNYILEESAKCGINTIVLDVGDGIKFSSHPEIAAPGAWEKERVAKEVKKCRDLGISLIPKLNFSSAHDMWLGKYSRMISTDIYYKVCTDLIKETYELFEKPKYFHLGMDEENAQIVKNHQLAIYRQGDLLISDIKYLIDYTKSLGTMPWIWSSPLFAYPEKYMEIISPDDAIISPWHYNAIRKEHWTPIETRSEYVVYYNEGEYAKMGIKFVEEDPFLVDVMNKAIPLSKHGYKYVPCASVFNRCDYNHNDLIEYFRDNMPDEQLLGFMSAPWMATVPEKENKLFYEETFKFYKEAKDKFYPQEK